MATNARVGLAGVLLCIASTQVSTAAAVESPTTSVTFGASVGTASPAPNVTYKRALGHAGRGWTIGVLEIRDTSDYPVLGRKACLRKVASNGVFWRGDLLFTVFDNQSSRHTVHTYFKINGTDRLAPSPTGNMCVTMGMEPVTIQWVNDGLEGMYGGPVMWRSLYVTFEVWFVNP